MTKVVFKTLKMNYKTKQYENVAQTSVEYGTIKEAKAILKSYVYKFDEMLSKGPVDFWSKRTVTKQAEYIFQAELVRGAA